MSKPTKSSYNIDPEVHEQLKIVSDWTGIPLSDWYEEGVRRILAMPEDKIAEAAQAIVKRRVERRFRVDSGARKRA